MKRSAIILMVVLLTGIAFESTAMFKAGLKGGLNLSNQRVSLDNFDLKDEVNMSAGFHIGPAVDLSLRRISLEAAVLFSMKGGEFTFDDPVSGEPEMTRNELYYIDVPLTLKFNYGISSISTVYGGLGPYFSYAVAGNSTVEYIDQNGELKTETDDIDWENDMKQQDIGLAMIAGADVRSFRVGITYHLGLTDTSRDDAFSSKNSVLGIFLGYWL